MKLIRAFVGFVVISLVVGLGSAFNGQANKPIEKIDNPVEVVENEIVSEEESTKIVEKQEKETVVAKDKTNNSFSASKEKKISSPVKETVKENKTTSKTNESNISQSKTNTENTDTNPPVEIQFEEKSNVDNSSNDDKYNATYYSITKGNAEYNTESSCKSAGLSIQNKELDSILDWNEEHPEELKKPIIGSSMCIVVMKDGKEHWYLHFLTNSGENLDDELKKLYK